MGGFNTEPSRSNKKRFDGSYSPIASQNRSSSSIGGASIEYLGPSGTFHALESDEGAPSLLESAWSDSSSSSSEESSSHSSSLSSERCDSSAAHLFSTAAKSAYA